MIDGLKEQPLNASRWDYIRIARPEHWIKHVFIIPGVLAAWILVDETETNLLGRALLATLSACLVSSANYVINEWLDAGHDRHHPLKKNRPFVLGRLSRSVVLVEYALLVTSGLITAWPLGVLFFATTCLFILSGIIYNVSPLRSKDIVYLDVLTEAINNPIRLTLGWAIVSTMTVPPLSLIGAYWFGGAFLMAAKRLAEFRFISMTSGLSAISLYRKSFASYSVNSLLISCFIYAIMASFMLAVFLIKYRTEYVLSFPLLTLLFGYYLHMALQPTSIAQRPEKLHRDMPLMAILLVLLVVMAILTFVDVPIIEKILQTHFSLIKLQ